MDVCHAAAYCSFNQRFVARRDADRKEHDSEVRCLLFLEATHCKAYVFRMNLDVRLLTLPFCMEVGCVKVIF